MERDRNSGQDHAQGIAWWRKSADQGYALAQYHLGRMYSRGEGVMADPAQATAWFYKAATQGHAAAQFSLGVAYAWAGSWLGPVQSGG
jgi:uncharacterized protein